MVIDVYDAAGRKVNSLMNKVSLPGRYIIEWDGKGKGGYALSSGLYFIRVKSGSNFEIKKVLLIK